MKLGRRAAIFGLLATTAGAFATGLQSRSRAQEAEAQFPPTGAFVDIDGTRVHYVQEGTGPHVVLLHGAGGTLREFTFDLMGRLSDRYTVTAFDRPGLGYTDRLDAVTQGALATEGESPAQQAEVLRRAAAEIGVVDPIVVGHSFGGIVSMAWAISGLDAPASEQNAKGVVSLAGVLMPWPGDLGWYYTVNGSPLGGLVTIPLISAFATDAQIAASVDGIFHPQPVPEGYLDHIGAPLALRPGQFRANARQVNTLRPHVVEMEKRYGDLTLPIEIVHGDLDTTVPIHVHPHEFVKIVDSANLTTLSGVGHMPHHADPDATIAAIDRAATRAGLR